MKGDVVVMVGRWTGTARNCSIERSMTVTLVLVLPRLAALKQRSSDILFACTQTSSHKYVAGVKHAGLAIERPCIQT